MGARGRGFTGEEHRAILSSRGGEKHHHLGGIKEYRLRGRRVNTAVQLGVAPVVPALALE